MKNYTFLWIYLLRTLFGIKERPEEKGVYHPRYHQGNLDYALRSMDPFHQIWQKLPGIRGKWVPSEKASKFLGFLNWLWINLMLVALVVGIYVIYLPPSAEAPTANATQQTSQVDEAIERPAELPPIDPENSVPSGHILAEVGDNPESLYWIEDTFIAGPGYEYGETWYVLNEFGGVRCRAIISAVKMVDMDTCTPDPGLYQLEVAGIETLPLVRVPNLVMLSPLPEAYDVCDSASSYAASNEGGDWYYNGSDIKPYVTFSAETGDMTVEYKETETKLDIGKGVVLYDPENSIGWGEFFWNCGDMYVVGFMNVIPVGPELLGFDLTDPDASVSGIRSSWGPENWSGQSDHVCSGEKPYVVIRYETPGEISYLIGFLDSQGNLQTLVYYPGFTLTSVSYYDERVLDVKVINLLDGNSPVYTYLHLHRCKGGVEITE